MYPNERTDPIRAEIQAMGLTSCTTAEAVTAQVGQPGSALILLNSVCGCAGGSARPGLSLALKNAGIRPDRVCTVFAGVDQEATAKARGYFADQPTTSPGFALLKDGKLAWILHRHQIQGRSPEQIAEQLTQAFAAHC